MKRHWSSFRLLAAVFLCTSMCAVKAPASEPDTLKGSAPLDVNDLVASPRLAFVQEPTNALAGVRISPPVTVQLKDKSGANFPQSGVAVTLTLTSGTGTLDGTATRATNSTGLASFDDLSIILPGTKKLTASSVGYASAASNNFTVSTGPATRLKIHTEPPSTATAGVPFSPQPVLWVEDAAGNRITGDNRTVATAARLAGTGTLQGTITATAQQGVVTFANLSLNVAGTISIGFTGAVLIPDTSTAVRILPGAAAQLAFLQQPSTAAAGAIMTPAVTVVVRDAFGNNLTTSGTTVTIRLGSGTGTLTGTLTSSTVSGVATFSNLSISAVGPKTLTATSGTLTAAQSNAFTITSGPGRALVFAQQPTTTAASAPISPPVTVRVVDSLGNSVAMPGVPVSLTILSGTGVLSGPTIRTTDTTGRATFEGLSINLAGNKVLAAGSPGLTTGTSVSFPITVGPVTRVQFVQQPTNTTAGSAIVPAVTVGLTDAQGNRVSAAGVQVSLALSSGTGVLTGTIPQLTDAAGLATFSNLSVNLAGLKRLTSSGSGLTSAVSDSFAIVAGSPVSLEFSTSPGGGTAGLPFGVQPVVTLIDAFGNRVLAAPQTVTLAIQNNAGGGGTLAGTRSVAVNTSTGQAAFTGLSIDKTGTGYTLTATGSTVSTVPGSVVSSPFTILAASPSKFIVENASNGTGTVLAVQNVTSGTTITVFGIARDPFDNFVANIAADAWGLVGLTGGVVAADLVPGADRKSATFTARLTGTAIVNATVSGLVSVPSGRITVVVAGTPASISVETTNNGTGIVVPSQSIPSGGRLTVYAVSRDAAKNFLANVAADAWTLQNKAGNIADGDLVASADRKSATFYGKRMGNTQIGATSGTLTAVNSGVLTVIAGPPATVTASSGTPQSARIGTPFPARFSATVLDTAGNPSSGVQVTWSSPPSGAGGSFGAGGNITATDSNGIARSGVFTANAVAGDYTVTASVPAVNTPALFALTNLVGAPAHITIVAGSRQSTTVKTTFPTALAAGVMDSAGNSVNGTMVTFRAPTSGASGTFSGGLLTAGVLTANGGIAVAPPFIANALAGNYSLAASVDGVDTPALFELTNTPGTAGIITAIAGTPQSTPVGSPFSTRLAIVLKDASGNPVPGISVTFTAPATGASGKFGEGRVDSVRTDSSGTAAAFPLVANTVAGAFTLLADAPGVSSPAAFLLTNTPGPVDTFIIDAAGGGRIGTEIAQVPFNIRITAYDQYGNRATQFAGTVDVTSNGVLSQAGTPSAPFSDGQLSSHTVALQNAGQFTILATRSGGAETGRADSFQVINPVPTIARVFPALGRKGETLNVIVSGWGFIAGVTTVSFGDRITTATTVNSLTQITVTLFIDTAAAEGPRDVFAINSPPGGGVGTLMSAFVVGNNPLPLLAAVSPDRGGMLQRLNMNLSGGNFVNGMSRVTMGSGILVNAVTVNSQNQMSADISITGLAAGGARKIAVINDPPGGGTSDSLFFSVDTPPTPHPVLASPADGASGVDTVVMFRWHPWLTSGIAYRLQVSTNPAFTAAVFDDATITDTTRQVTSLGRGTTYYWRLIAWNAVGSSESSPAWSFTTSTPYPTTYVLVDTVSFPSHALNATYQMTDYRLMGLPGDSRISVSNFLTGTRNVDWVVYWDNGAPSDYLAAFDASSSFTCTPGRAFWILHRGSVVISRTVPTATLDSTRGVRIPLHPGWNLITNPFLAPVPWTAVQQANAPGITADPWGYDGSFVRATSLLPCRGYLYDNTDNRATLRVPMSQGGTAKSRLDPGQWRIGISLKTGTIIDRTTSIGVSAVASVDRDPFDLRMPRGIGTAPGVFFSRPGWDIGGSVFASDIRPEISSVEIWPMEVRGKIQQQAQLTFDGVENVPERYRVALIDDEQDVTIDLRADAVYRFTPATPLSRFRIVVGTDESVRVVLEDVLPKEFALEKNFPNPFNPSTTIPVSIPRASAVSIVIYTILGEEVRKLHEGPLSAGRHLFHWDGTTDQGRPISSGVYLVRFGNGDGKVFVGKMLLLK